MTSLKQRTILVVLLAETLCAVGFSGAALIHERRMRLRTFDVMLQGRSDSLLGAIQDAEDPEDNVRIDPQELHVPADDVYAVYNLGGRLLGGSGRMPAAVVERARDGFSDRDAGGQTYRVYQREAMRIIDRSETNGVGLQRPVTILYGSPVRHRWGGILEAVSFYVVASLLLLGITAGLMIVLLRRVLEPIQELATEAASVSMKDLVFQAPESALRISELEPLAVTLSTTIGGLREAVEQQHRFVSDAAHELKTAVAVVRSTIQLLMLRPQSIEEYALGLERLLTDNTRVEELVGRMLLLARLEERMGEDCAESDLAEPLERAVSHLRSFAEEHAVEVVTSVEHGMAVRLLPEQAEILVSNLVVNAIQHSPAGSAVAVSLARQGDRAVMQVKDDGSGISAEAAPYVFHRFFREDSSRSRETGGTGLGLAICKSIVERADGSIQLESTKGRGTTVTVIFMLA